MNVNVSFVFRKIIKAKWEGITYCSSSTYVFLDNYGVEQTREHLAPCTNTASSGTCRL